MSNPSENPTTHLLANCSACQGLVRVPATAKPDQEVSCPHCSGSFSLVQVLDQQVPEVQFRNGEAPDVDLASFKVVPAGEPVNEAPVIEPGSKFQVPPQLAKGIRKRRKRRRSRSSSESSKTTRGSEAHENIKSRRDERRREDAQKQAEALNVVRHESSSVESSTTSSASSSSSHRGGSSQRQKQRRPGGNADRENSAAEWIKILLGGALAIPIAYMLLLWGFGRDPLSVAPTIHRFVPALVPDYMAGTDTEDGEDVPSAEGESNSSVDRLPFPETDPDDIGDVPDSTIL